ncbi:uncharacterized protein MONOS_17077 [Monocercomonoides exilis]|uniref:uncharacterized protein n=1 Tax=Monocercomonoides exilis TaxID=2049356 RepID=UPI003559A2BB|nr:hypothetical protein MONOS_17077 [Monocercomonoides exilis]
MQPEHRRHAEDEESFQDDEETIQRMINTAREIKNKTKQINDEVQVQQGILEQMKESMSKAAGQLSSSTKNIANFIKENPESTIKMLIVFVFTICFLIWFFFFKLKL